MPEDNELSGSTQVDNLNGSAGVGTEPGGSHTVKIDGAEHQVSLNELRDGYQRQADYTRKTQDLATERQRLQQAETIVAALEADPANTLQALSTAFGIDADTQAAPNTDLEPWEEGYQDPNEHRLAKIEATLDRQASADRQQVLHSEVMALKQQYGDFDAQALYQHALRNKIPNLSAAFTHMHFGEVAAAAQRLQADQNVTEAKRSGVPVAGGNSTQSGAVVSGADVRKKVSSIREAFNLAKQQHG